MIIFNDNTLLVSQGVYFPTIIREAKLGADALQPFWEAFTNALEAIADSPGKIGNGKIVVQVHFRGDLLGGGDF